MGGAPPQDLLTDSLGPSSNPPQEPPQLQSFPQSMAAPPGQEQSAQGGLGMPPPPPPNPGRKKGFFG